MPYFVTMLPEPALVEPPALEVIRGRVDRVLESFLLARRDDMAALAAEAADLVDEIRRLVVAGGKRIRPAFCYWGHRAAGGPDGEPILRAAAALELFHTFALIHDDVMDESDTRRGVPSAHARFAEARFASARRGSADAVRYGRSVAVLAGDLAAVLADDLLVGSGFPPDRLLPAHRRYIRMQTEVAAGQFLDVGGAGSEDEAASRRVASLKTGAYTVEGPLHIGALLAGGSPDVLSALSRFAEPLGRAFQHRDDVLDHGEGTVPGATAAQVNRLIGEACAALDDPVLVPEGAVALRSLALALALPEG